MQIASKTYGTRECANPACKNEFEVRRVNMIYCSNDCCKVATNAKLIARYHAKKNKNTGERRCACGAKLSRYNSNSKCHACIIADEQRERSVLLKELGIEYIDEDA
jgi:hypothetical protein